MRAGPCASAALAIAASALPVSATSHSQNMPPDLAGNRAALDRVAVEHGDARAKRREMSRGRGAEPRRRSGHENRCSDNFHGHRFKKTQVPIQAPDHTKQCLGTRDNVDETGRPSFFWQRLPICDKPRLLLPLATHPMIPIFDGHNDVLLRLMLKSEPDGGAASFLDGDGAGHLDLPRAREGGFAGGLFAVFVPPAKRDADSDNMDKLMQSETYDVPLPDQSELTQAQVVALQMVSLLFRIVRRSEGAVRLCRDVKDIRASVDAGALATVLHFEGAEAIDRNFRMLEVLYEAGLRSLGPVWSRPNIFGHGVPFRFPSTPDTGPGLTDDGRALVRACNELGILIDLSHLNEKGFWDVAELSEAPLVATHSNVHALSQHSRNLTDRQLAAIRESGGMVGLNFAACFLRADGRMRADTPLPTWCATPTI